MFVRLNEFQTRGRGPKTFRGLQTDLAVLIDALRSTQSAIKTGRLSEATRSALCPAIHSCRDQIGALDALVAKYLPRPGDSWVTRSMKAMASLRQDGQVAEMCAQLNLSVQALTLHHVSTVVSSLLRPQQAIVIP